MGEKSSRQENGKHAVRARKRHSQRQAMNTDASHQSNFTTCDTLRQQIKGRTALVRFHTHPADSAQRKYMFF
jgi:hypothetical protein